MRRHHFSAILLGLSTTCLMLSSGPSTAQWGYMSPSREPPMLAEDFRIQRSTAVDLLSSGRTGDSRRWSNPGSGAQGEVSLLDEFQERGVQCRRVKYISLTRGASSQTEVVLKACREPNGNWAIVG